MSDKPPAKLVAPVVDTAHQERGRETSSGDYKLVIRQKPFVAKVFVGNEEDRVPVDPPPIIQLHASELVDPYEFSVQSPYFFVSASLVDDYTHLQMGETETSHTLADNTDGAFFVFGDLSVEVEGIFKLQFTLYEVLDRKVLCITSVTSGPFTVYASKHWPGVAESTFLARCFSDQGVRLRLWQEPRSRLGVRRPTSDIYESRQDWYNDWKQDQTGLTYEIEGSQQRYQQSQVGIGSQTPIQSDHSGQLQQPDLTGRTPIPLSQLAKHDQPPSSLTSLSYTASLASGSSIWDTTGIERAVSTLESSPGPGDICQEIGIKSKPNSIEEESEMCEAGKSTSKEEAKNHKKEFPYQQQDYDEIRSVTSDKEDIDSMAEPDGLDDERAAEEYLRMMLTRHEKLKPLFEEALQTIGRDRFVNNFRRLLKRFYLDLSHTANTKLERTSIQLLRSRMRRTRIAVRIADEIDPGSDESYLAQMSNLEEDNSRRIIIERFLDAQGKMHLGFGIDEPVIPDNEKECNFTIKEWNNRENDLSDSEVDIEESGEAQWPKVTHMEEFMVQSGSFDALLLNFQTSLLPTDLSSVTLTRVLMSIPTDRIWFSTEDDLSLSNLVKFMIEDYSVGGWNWWPFRLRMRPLIKNEMRLHWRFHCGTHLWKELPTQHAQKYQWLINKRKSVVESAHLCSRRDLEHNETRFSKRMVKVLREFSTMALWNKWVRPILPVSMAPAQVTQPAKSIQKTQTTSPSTSNQRMTSDRSLEHGKGRSTQRASNNVILFGVKGSRRTLRMAQIKTESHKEDYSFFFDLRNRYKELRGFWRRWFSVWQFNHCDFVKFEKIQAEPVVVRKKDLPEAKHPYEYNPRPPAAENPPITLHEFEIALSTCRTKCKLRLFHDCIKPRMGAFAIQRIPKMKSLWDIHTDTWESAWGLQAQYAISLIRVISYHGIILAAAFGFWAWWQAKHPGDLQNASIPLTIVVTLCYMFWASAGILKSSTVEQI